MAMRKSIHNWSIGILGIIGYAYLFLAQKLYADFGLQFIFVIQSVWAFIEWRKGDLKELVPFNKSMFWIFLLGIFNVMVYSFIKYTDNPLPVLDSLATTLSIGATWLMAKKKISAWLMWIAADIVYIIIFIDQKLFLSTALYIIFVVLCIKGYNDWKTKTNE